MTDPGDDEDEQVLGGELARTELAWSRSGLAVVVAAAAILKVVANADDLHPSVLVYSLLIAGAVAGALAIAHAHFVATSALAGRAHGDPARLRFVATVTGGFAIVALVIALLPQG